MYSTWPLAVCLLGACVCANNTRNRYNNYGQRRTIASARKLSPKKMVRACVCIGNGGQPFGKASKIDDNCQREIEIKSRGKKSNGHDMLHTRWVPQCVRQYSDRRIARFPESAIYFFCLSLKHVNLWSLAFT